MLNLIVLVEFLKDMISNYNNNRIAINSIFLYVRMFITMGISLFTSRVVLRTLGADDFGLYNVVGGIIVIVSFLNSALSGATRRFITYELGKEEKSDVSAVYSTSLIVHGVISIFLFLMCESIGLWFLQNYLTIPLGRMDAAFSVYQFSLFSAIVVLVNIPHYSLLIAYERLGAFASISIIEALLKLVLVYLIQFIKMDKLVVYASVIFFLSLATQLSYFLYVKLKISNVCFSLKVQKEVFHKMLNFTSWNLFGNLSHVGYTQGVNVLLNVFFGTTVNASRAISLQVQGAVDAFVTNFQMAVNPQITKSCAQKDYKTFHNLIFQSSKLSFFLLLCIVVPIFFNVDYILSIWLHTVPPYTSDFVRIFLWISLVNCIEKPLLVGITSTGDIKYHHLVVSGLLFLILPISYLSLRIYSNPVLPFLIHLLVLLLVQSVRIYMSRLLLKMSAKLYFSNVIFPVLFVFFISFVICYLFNNSFNIPNLTVITLKMLGSCLICISVIYLFGLSKSERLYCKNKCSSISYSVRSKI